jgi:hypothetical protein
MLTFYPVMGGAGWRSDRIDDIAAPVPGRDDVQSEKMLCWWPCRRHGHEINNPLGAILHNVQNIRRRLSPICQEP